MVVTRGSRTTDNPRHSKKREHTHEPHIHPPGTNEYNVPHVHTVHYKAKDGTEKVYKYPYELVGKRLRNR